MQIIFLKNQIISGDISMTVAESGKSNGIVPMVLHSSVLASKPFDFSKYFIAHLYMTKKGKNSQIIFKLFFEPVKLGEYRWTIQKRPMTDGDCGIGKCAAEK